MGFFKRILGICRTKPPVDGACWAFSRDQVEIDLPRAPELSKPGGAVRLEGRGLPERLMVLRGPNDKFYAYKNRCTHMGRRIDPVADNKALQCCSVSKSTYDFAGKVVSGPAKGPLTTYKTVSKEGKLIISLK